MEFELRLLLPADNIKTIKSGDPQFHPLSTFLKQQAKSFQSHSLARTYVLIDKGIDRIAAYITLVCSEVASKPDLLQGQNVTFGYDQYPAVKIARLLVDSRYRNEDFKGLGRSLVEFSIGIAQTEISQAVGCRFVVVDAKKNSVGFYEKCGFTLIDTADNRNSETPVLYLDLYKASQFADQV